MIDHEMRDRLAGSMEQLKQQMAELTAAQHEWAKLTVSGSAAGKRVTVLVNANGVIIETRFANDIDDLDHSELAAAITEAHQSAMKELTRKTAELMDPVRARAMAGVGLEGLAGDLPDPLDPLAGLVEPSTAPPKALIEDAAADRDAGSRGVLRRTW